MVVVMKAIPEAATSRAIMPMEQKYESNAVLRKVFPVPPCPYKNIRTYFACLSDAITVL